MNNYFLSQYSIQDTHQRLFQKYFISDRSCLILNLLFYLQTLHSAVLLQMSLCSVINSQSIQKYCHSIVKFMHSKKYVERGFTCCKCHMFSQFLSTLIFTPHTKGKFHSPFTISREKICTAHPYPKIWYFRHYKYLFVLNFS